MQHPEEYAPHMQELFPETVVSRDGERMKLQ
jgi:hypothetical protein